MAYSNPIIWEIWSTGGANNGGGFNPANASMATDLTTDAATGNTASPVVSSASYNFVAGDVGAWVFIQAGTDWIPGWYIIASVAANKATLTAGVGTAVLYGTSSIGLNYQRPNGLNTLDGVATVGTPTNGTWSIDYSQQTGAGISYTDMTSVGAGSTYSSAANPVGPNIVGNVVNITAGTNFTTGRFEIISQAALVATVDRAITTGVGLGGTGILGGAISTIATCLGLALTAGNRIFLKATATYTLTSNVVITAAAKGDTTNGRIIFEGYTTYPGERDGRPLITTATNNVSFVTLNDNDFWEFIHIRGTCTSATKQTMFLGATSSSASLVFKDIICDGWLAFHNGNQAGSPYTLQGVEIMNSTSTTGAVNSGNSGWVGTLNLFGCDIHDNAGPGVRLRDNAAIYAIQDTIFDANTIGVDASLLTTNTMTADFRGNLFVDNTSDGIQIANTSGAVSLQIQNNIFYGNGGYGINNASSQAAIIANNRINRNNAYGSNTSGSYVGFSGGKGDITLTADPFKDRANRNFAPTPALKDTAFPMTNPSATTITHRTTGFAETKPSPYIIGG